MEKGSPAEELIKSYPPGGNSYEKALKQLKMRFGREELLIQVYVRDLLVLVLQKQNTSKNSLRKLFDQLESKLRSLELLGVTREKYAAMLFPLVESSLPEETLVAWQRYRSAHRRIREVNLDDSDESKTIIEKSDLECILEFLQAEVEAEERIFLASQSFNTSKPKAEVKHNLSYEKKVIENKCKSRKFSNIPSATDLLTSSQVSKQCIFCSNSHFSGDCLKKDAPKITMSKNEESPEVEKKTEISAEVDQALSNLSSTPDVMLQTFKVIIRSNGKKRVARAIIDTASQRSYLLRSTAKEMNYEPQSCEYLQHSLFGGKDSGICKHDVYTLYLSSVHGNYNCNFKVLSQQIICKSVPPTVNKLCLKELAACNINIVDDCQNPIEILIGADVAGKLMTGGRRELPCGLVAIETKFGWSVMGRMPNTSKSEFSSSFLVTSLLSTVETITDLWTLDTLGITDPSVKKNQTELQEAARLHFLNTVRIVDDRFEVDLPWLEYHPPLTDYFDLAERRLNKTVKRLKIESNYEAYGDVFKEWLEEGVIEEADKNYQGQVLYLPHREVIKKNSTTKLRPVFDACFGQKQLPSILTRFRKEKIGVIADIRRAFLQISVSPTDRDFLRFLWLDSDGQLKVYRHCRVVFGVASSPFLLNSTIQLHLQTVLEKIETGESLYTKGVIQKLMHSFYVDNCVSCVKNEEELIILLVYQLR
ncbi:uncharacterized protein LOC118191607 [Stegodyphus dumicola]|uniref:uncharacterized protein LOC118191607 n=1 Tax=Stegodyphus dumicola TaxID=202533 RepID=UPI0015ACC807|nr:uncharacterized protein LOC118191607 [Stegodyphus dumicola]